MSGSRLTWIVFSLCLSVVLAAMGWVTNTTWRLEQAEAEAARQSENERLALWRMDSAMVALITQESSRPHYAYLSFYRAENAFSRMLAPIRPGEVQVPSELLTFQSPFVVLHFQYGAGAVTSPQVPHSNERDLAESRYVTHERIEFSCQRLDELTAAVTYEDLKTALGVESHPEDLPADRNDFADVEPAIPNQSVTIRDSQIPEPLQSQYSQRAQIRQTERSLAEFRSRSWATANNSAYAGQQEVNGELIINGIQNTADAADDVQQGVMKAVWVNDLLLLVRHTVIDGADYVQGCLLDWEAIATRLTADVKDLLPDAQLKPVLDPDAAMGPLRLASLPLELNPGLAPVEPLPAMTPLRLSLVLAWIGLLLAALAVALLLWAAMRLSERRGAFVSAVTHELRTPLTTFRMYTEMLADGVVTEEKKRNQYLKTLRVEAERLGHLVENVLSYARLERNGRTATMEDVAAHELLERMSESLSQRTERAGMSLEIDVPADPPLFMHVDRAAVERILFNLVDNACKYANPEIDRRIHIQAKQDGRRIVLCIRDHGQGITRKESRRLFRAFSKSAKEAAHTAPGVGLGLALCRRLARSMKGDLAVDHNIADGASFVLTLPAARSHVH